MSSTTSVSTVSPSWHYKYVHEMNSTERLQSLKEWAEEKKYVYPGEGGTLPSGSIGGMNSLVYGSLLRTTVSTSQSNDKYGGQYEGRVGPPSYATATSDDSRKKKKGAMGKWLDKRKAKKAAKSNDSAPPYVP